MLMRLLHVICTTNRESGGPIEALRRIAEVLTKDGNEIHVVSLESEEEAVGRDLQVPIFAMGSLGKRYRFSPAFAPWVRSNAPRYDAVIVHGIWNYSSVGVWRALREQSTPYFVFTHGMMDPWFREGYPAKHIMKQCYWWLLEGRVLRDARSVLFTCEEEMLRARKSFVGHSYREQVVPYGTADPGCDVREWQAAFYEAYPALRGRRYLLFVGRIHPKKGCDILIDAFAQVAPLLPDDVQLVFAGPDQSGWVRALQSRARNLSIERRIHWTGMLTGAAKWGAFASAEAMILPSHQENFGFVVAEAMACKTPVLISDKVNIWREVVAAQAGMMESDTAEGTCNLLRRFWELKEEERMAMGRRAREGFLRHFDIQTTARGYLRTIQSLIENKVPA